MPAAAERPDGGDLVPPPDRAGGQGVEQDPPQGTPVHFRTPAGAVVGLVVQDRSVLVEHARGLAALVDDAEEFLEQPGRLEGQLPVVVVDVEHAALDAGGR